MSRLAFSFLVGIFIFVNSTSEFAFSSEGSSSNLAHLNNSKICEMADKHIEESMKGQDMVRDTRTEGEI